MDKAIATSRPLKCPDTGALISLLCAFLAILALPGCAETGTMREALAPPPPATLSAATEFSYEPVIEQRVFTLANIDTITDIQPEAGGAGDSSPAKPCGTRENAGTNGSPLALDMGGGTMRFAMLREEAVEPSARPTPSPMIRYTMSLPDPAGKTCVQ